MKAYPGRITIIACLPAVAPLALFLGAFWLFAAGCGREEKGARDHDGQPPGPAPSRAPAEATAESAAPEQPAPAPTKAPPPKDPRARERIRRLRNAAERLVSKRTGAALPGLSLAIIRGGRIEWAGGFGAAEQGSGRRVGADTLFQAASISKPLAALAAITLLERGTLELDEDVNTRLRSWKVPESPVSRGHKVTLRRLLNHTAGMTVHGFPGYSPDRPLPTLRQVLDGLPPANTSPIRVGAVPGRGFRYSGGGYCIVQQLLIDVGGMPFPQLMRERVLGPLGMKRSTCEQPLPARLRRDAAAGPQLDGRRVRGRWHVYPEMAAAGLWTTPSDLARFLIGVRRAWAGLPGAIISRRRARQMVQTGAKTPWGLGLELGGEGPGAFIAHGGANEGFGCYMLLYLERGDGAVVMVNSDDGRPLSGMLDLIGELYEWPK